MSSYIVNPHLQFVDEDGKPLAYGTIDTYIAGTSIAYTTMKDFSGTMNPSTIILDDDGSCTIIIPEDQLIKMVIKTNEGRLYKTYDNVGAGGSGSGGGDYVGSDYIAIDQIARVISLKNVKQIITDGTILMERKPDKIILKVNPTLLDSKEIVAGDGIDIEENDNQITIKSKTSNLNIDTTSDLITVEKSYDKAANLTTWTIDGSNLDTWKTDVDDFITSINQWKNGVDTYIENNDEFVSNINEWKSGVDEYIDSHDGKLTITYNGESKEYDGTEDVSIDIAKELPSTEGAEHGDVLTVRRSGGHGTLAIGWYKPETKVFIGHYTGVNSTSTTYSEFYGKFVDGYMCVLEVTLLGGTSYYVMDTCDSSKITFTRSVPTSNGVKPTIAMYVLNNDNTYNYLYSNLATDYTSGYGIKVENNVISNTLHETTFSTQVMWSTLANSGTTNIQIGSSPWRIELKRVGSSTWDDFRIEDYIKYMGSDAETNKLNENGAHYIQESWFTNADATTHQTHHQNVIGGNEHWMGNNWFTTHLCNPRIKRYLIRCQMNTGYLNNDWIDAYFEWWLLGSKDETYTAGTSCNIRVWGTYHYA